MDRCIFCDIIAGRAPASIVYETETVLAFIDRRQPTSAHVLVVPKLHAETLDLLPLDVAGPLMQAAVVTARAMRRTLRPEGLSLWQSNGEVAGQEVPHVHLHLLTRQADDGLLRIYPERPSTPDREALDALAARIREGFATQSPQLTLPR
jgi:histidine triad (HIT) family protein